MGILPAAQRIVNRFYARRVAHFAVCLTCTAPTLTLPHQAMSFFPYGTLAEITHEIRSKNVSPVEIVDSHLKRLEALHPKLNTFVHLNGEGARRQSHVAESLVLRGAQLGALHGVPLTIKSCIDVAGWPCPAGSLLRKDYVANQDARRAELAATAAARFACPPILAESAD